MYVPWPREDLLYKRSFFLHNVEGRGGGGGIGRIHIVQEHICFSTGELPLKENRVRIK